MGTSREDARTPGPATPSKWRPHPTDDDDDDAHLEYRIVSARVYEQLAQRCAKRPPAEEGDAGCPEERGKRFAAAAYGVDPEAYVAAVCSIDCATFVTHLAHRDLARWARWKDDWAARLCPVDPILWAQASWALAIPFKAKFQGAEAQRSKDSCSRSNSCVWALDA